MSDYEVHCVIRVFITKLNLLLLSFMYRPELLRIQMVYRWHTSFLKERTNVRDKPNNGRPSTEFSSGWRLDASPSKKFLRDNLSISRQLRNYQSISKSLLTVCTPFVVSRTQREEDYCRAQVAWNFLGKKRWSCEPRSNRRWKMRLPLHSWNEMRKDGLENHIEKVPKKSQVACPAGKVIVIVFWNAKGVLFVVYLPYGVTINTERYCEAQKNLRSDFFESRRIYCSLFMLDFRPSSPYRQRFQIDI